MTIGYQGGSGLTKLCGWISNTTSDAADAVWCSNRAEPGSNFCGEHGPGPKEGDTILPSDVGKVPPWLKGWKVVGRDGSWVTVDPVRRWYWWLFPSAWKTRTHHSANP